MEAAALIATLHARGARFHLLEGGRLGVEPRERLTDKLRDEIRRHKQAILQHLASEATLLGQDPPSEPRASEPPLRRLEQAWAAAVERAHQGFFTVGREPSEHDLRGAARLELLLDRDVKPPDLKMSVEIVRGFLPGVYTGRFVARLGPWGRPHLATHESVIRFCRAATADAPIGKMRCHGCDKLMPEHDGALCFCCDLGVDRADFPTKLMPFALELRGRLGPAGGWGLRVEEIRQLSAEAKRLKRRRVGAGR